MKAINQDEPVPLSKANIEIGISVCVSLGFCEENTSDTEGYGDDGDATTVTVTDRYVDHTQVGDGGPTLDGNNGNSKASDDGHTETSEDGHTKDGDDGHTKDGDDGHTKDGDDGNTKDGDDGHTQDGDNGYTQDGEDDGPDPKIKGKFS